MSKNEVKTWIKVICIFILWIAIVFIGNNGQVINWDTVIKLPDAIGYYFIFELIFRKWLWKFKIFKGWLVDFPYIHGTWEGILTSTWKDKHTEIPVKMSINQTYDKVSCSLFTKESTSISNIANFITDDSGTQFLIYNYGNTPDAEKREISQIHNGASRLRIVTDVKLKMEGQYWTDRKTTGDISLLFKSRKLTHSFD